MTTDKKDQVTIQSNELLNHVASKKKEGQLINACLEIKMAEENINSDIESTPVKDVDIEKYVESKLKSALNGDGKDTLEIRQITLRMAKMWDDKGHIYEAIDLYKKLFKEHAGSSEAEEAKKALTKHAEKFEQEGRHHQAHALYNDIFL